MCEIIPIALFFVFNYLFNERNWRARVLNVSDPIFVIIEKDFEHPRYILAVS